MVYSPTFQPPFQYYGSKARLAPWIVSHIPEHLAYIEPFAGSAAILLAKPRSRYEVINDLNGDVVNFWRVLRERHDELVGVLQLTPYARAEYLESRDSQAPASDALERARVFFVRASMAFNASTARVGYSASSPGKNGHKPTTFRRRIDARLAEVAERMRDVELENVDALTLLRRWRRPQSVAYLDPPYVGTARASHGDYATDNGGNAFHAEIMSAVGDFPGVVILSGYPGSPYDELGWRREERTVAAHTSNTPGASRTECLWINR